MGFLLASASPRRLALLQQVGLIPDGVVSTDIDERPLPAELPRACVRRLAEAKARSAAASHPGRVILAADTTVACGRRLLGKPADAAEAERFLRLLSGRRHRVYTGIAVLDGECLRAREVVTQVVFKRLSDEEIARYLAVREWEGKAGGYAIQGLAERYIQAIHGSYSNVVGLPLLETCGLLERSFPSSKRH